MSASMGQAETTVPAEGAGQSGTRKDKSLWSYIAAGISAGLLLLVLAIAALVLVVPWLTGSVPLTILTQSMQPALPPGTLVVVKPADPADIQIGDVVTYQLNPGQPELVTHRVVAVSQTTSGASSFVLKGDNNAEPDANPVVPAQIKGKVWYSLPWIGWVNSAVGGGGKTWLIIGLAVLLFAYAGWMFIGGLFDRRKKKSAGEAALAQERAREAEARAREAEARAREAEARADQAERRARHGAPAGAGSASPGPAE